MVSNDRGGVGYLDALDGALGGADDVVVDHQAFEAETPAGWPACQPIRRQVGAGIADQRVIIAFS